MEENEDGLPLGGGSSATSEPSWESNLAAMVADDERNKQYLVIRYHSGRNLTGETTKVRDEHADPHELFLVQNDIEISQTLTDLRNKQPEAGQPYVDIIVYIFDPFNPGNVDKNRETVRIAPEKIAGFQSTIQPQQQKQISNDEDRGWQQRKIQEDALRKFFTAEDNLVRSNATTKAIAIHRAHLQSTADAHDKRLDNHRQRLQRSEVSIEILSIESNATFFINHYLYRCGEITGRANTAMNNRRLSWAKRIGFGVVAALAGVGGFVAGYLAGALATMGTDGTLIVGLGLGLSAGAAAGGGTFWGLRRWDRSRQKKAIETSMQTDLDTLKRDFQDTFFPKDSDAPGQIHNTINVGGKGIQITTELKQEIARLYRTLGIEAKIEKKVAAVGEEREDSGVHPEHQENFPLLNRSGKNTKR